MAESDGTGTRFGRDVRLPEIVPLGLVLEATCPIFGLAQAERYLLIKDIEGSKAKKPFRINKTTRKIVKSKANQSHQSQKANAASCLESEEAK